jgi:hypothetical protein
LESVFPISTELEDQLRVLGKSKARRARAIAEVVPAPTAVVTTFSAAINDLREQGANV